MITVLLYSCSAVATAVLHWKTALQHARAQHVSGLPRCAPPKPQAGIKESLRSSTTTRQALLHIGGTLQI